MLKQRLITAIILIPLIVWDVLGFSSQSLAAVLSIFVLIGAWEWAAICGWQEQTQRSGYVLANAISLGILYCGLTWLPHSGTYLYILLIACVWWLLALGWVLHYQQGYNHMPTSPWIKALLGFLILLPAWSALFVLHDRYGGEGVLFLLILIWSADSGAYFVGRRWGRLKLADKISPGKTWEGVAGGIMFSLIVAFGYALFKAMSLLTIIIFMLLCFITVLASILGDLLESLFKRQAGLKDSGQLLPGHGGVLDRIDSFTSAAPVFVMGIVTLGIIL